MPKKRIHKCNCNLPKRVVEIYDKILAIEARKGKKSNWPNGKFRHDFSKSVKSKIYGLEDGSILIKPASKKKLWKEFDYK